MLQGIYDRIVVQDVIKEIAGSNSLHSRGATGGAAEEGGVRACGFKVVVLMEVDRLTKQAQAALRRTMEKYTSSCRLILYCSNPTKARAFRRRGCSRLGATRPPGATVLGPSFGFVYVASLLGGCRTLL